MTLAMQLLGFYLKVGTTAASILILAIVICISQKKRKKRNGTQTSTAMMTGIVIMATITHLIIYETLKSICLIPRESVALLLSLIIAFREIQVITPTKIKME